MSACQANTPGRFLSQAQGAGGGREPCCTVDFKAVKAQGEGGGVAKMSVSVIHEVLSENSDACLLSPFLHCLGAAGRLARELPPCNTQSNTKAVSNILSLIQNN